MSPLVAMGLGLTYASAARIPGVALILSDAFTSGSEVIDGVFKLAFKLSVDMDDVSVNWVCEKDGEARSGR